MEKGLRINFQEYKKLHLAGIRCGEFKFLNDLTDSWLNRFPNEIRSTLNKAEVEFLNGSQSEANNQIQSIIDRDPEYFECYELLSKHTKGNEEFLNSALYAIAGEVNEIDEVSPWAVTLRSAKNEFKRRNLDIAEKLIRTALSEDPNNILIAIEHYRITSIINDTESNSQLTNIYNQRWEKCLQFKIWAVIDLMKSNKEAEAISMLHECAQSDPEGIVIKRLLGNNHEYLEIWSNEREILFNQQVPTSVAVSLNWNLLNPGRKVRKESKGIVDTAQNETISKKQYLLQERKSDKNSPYVYVILSSRTGLTKKYGPKTTDVILNKLDELSNTINQKPQWESFVLLPDDSNSMSRWGINETSEIDPWKIKLSLMDLEEELIKNEKNIRSVIIIGNHDIIPFHRLPNPTEDGDKDVLSDNPYSTSTSNYLIPEWPIGRLPGEKGSDPGLLLEQIRHVTEFHASQIYSKSLVTKIRDYFARIFNFFQIIRNYIKKPRDFGYSAEVWRRSSLASFRPIGKGADLRISPPYDYETIDTENLMKAKCAYFNLHGLSNTSEWYGQRDFSKSAKDPDFPVAFSAKGIKKTINNIDLVFTEACYGGFILDKYIDESIALKLISIGSQGLVGSTCISYGSVFTPLIGGDLLGFIFWTHIKEGYSFGESLLQAKLEFIKAMHRRQGYLDGEDQKTLLSFVLYGDPLGLLEPNIYLDKKQGEQYSESDINLVSDQDGFYSTKKNLSNNTINDLNELLQSYIPGLENADIKVKKHKINLTKIMNNDVQPDNKIGSNLEYKNLTQILYNRSTVSENLEHRQYARITMDDGGKIIKLAISR